MQDEMFEKLHNIQVCQILKDMDLDIQCDITEEQRFTTHVRFHNFIVPSWYLKAFEFTVMTWTLKTWI